MFFLLQNRPKSRKKWKNKIEKNSIVLRLRKVIVAEDAFYFQSYSGFFRNFNFFCTRTTYEIADVNFELNTLMQRAAAVVRAPTRTGAPSILVARILSAPGFRFIRRFLCRVQYLLHYFTLCHR